MQEAVPLITFCVVAAVVAVLVAVSQSRRSAAIVETLTSLARDSNAMDVQTSKFFGIRLRAMWNGYPLEIRRLPRQKSVPERLVTRVRLQVPARMAITRRRHGLFSRPFAMFGPPIVEYPAAGEFWVRSDEISLVERLFGTSIPSLLAQSLNGRYDVVRMGGDALTIQRESNTDVMQVRRIAREELELARR